MKSKKALCIVLILTTLLSFSGCAKTGLFFKRKNIDSLYFQMSLKNGTVVSENVTDPEVIDRVYDVLKKIKFNNKRPRNNILSGEKYSYYAPATYHILGINTKKNGTLNLEIDMYNRCFVTTDYRRYSTAGEELVEIMTEYFDEQY